MSMRGDIEMVSTATLAMWLTGIQLENLGRWTRPLEPGHQLIHCGHGDMVELLPNHAASADSANSTGRSPLPSACIGDDRRIAKLLLGNRAGVDFRSVHHVFWDHTPYLIRQILT